jgi:hypothetical protein
MKIKRLDNKRGIDSKVKIVPKLTLTWAIIATYKKH